MKPTRRRFLETLFGAPLAATWVRPGQASLDVFGAPGAIFGPQLFMQPHFIRYDSHCFTINDRDTFIVSGAMHYPRCPKAHWRDRLLKFRQAGFNTIETYVFWNYHEPEEGRSNLGEFEEFVQLVKEMRLWLIARPGPYVCAEWERGGFPQWVAAKQFPLRSNHPESIKTSQHWFNQVLPIIRRYQVTASGPIIMVQIENEYDYCRQVPEAEHREYLRALAHMAWDAGIDVPLITCWTRQARENADPDMARIMDTCNFYPRWDILKQVPPALKKLRQEEPHSPVGVTELQGGWFSEFGNKLSVDQDGLNGAQLDLLTKTVIEQGATYYNYYMGFGGTNFDWAAKTMTTTYDYAAPVREPGGLWEKYYSARGICQSVRLFGNVLTRAERVEGATECTNRSVSVTERVNASSAVVFVREDANAEQRFRMKFRDPASPTQRIISVPREGELALGPREMKMLPLQIPIPGSKLRYSTAEILHAGLNLDRHFLIVYDNPGRLIEIALATEHEPKVEGDTAYLYWDQEYESVVIGFRLDRDQKMLRVNNDLFVLALPRERALRTWTAEFPSRVVPGVEENKPMAIPFITDSVLLASSDSLHNRIWVDLDFRPGEHQLSVLLPTQPSKCRLDGALTELQYDRPWRTARLQVATPTLPSRPTDLREVDAWVERFDPGSGNWLKSPAQPLEELGPVPYGYVKYRAEFMYDGQPKIHIATFAEDYKKVFVNGRLVPEASNSRKSAELPAPLYAKRGANTIEISYEAFGSPNFGDKLGELKGIESIRAGADPSSGAPIEIWQIQLFPAPMRGRQLDPTFQEGVWKPASLGSAAPAKELVPAFAWCRAHFALQKPSEEWWSPWKVTFEADRDALLYLNGKFVGRYVTVGPQKDFFLPDPYLNFGSINNTLTVILAYADDPGHIRTLRIAPYEEFATRRTRVEFEW